MSWSSPVTGVAAAERAAPRPPAAAVTPDGAARTVGRGTKGMLAIACILWDSCGRRAWTSWRLPSGGVSRPSHVGNRPPEAAHKRERSLLAANEPSAARETAINFILESVHWMTANEIKGDREARGWSQLFREASFELTKWGGMVRSSPPFRSAPLGPALARGSFPALPARCRAHTSSNAHSLIAVRTFLLRDRKRAAPQGSSRALG